MLNLLTKLRDWEETEGKRSDGTTYHVSQNSKLTEDDGKVGIG